MTSVQVYLTSFPALFQFFNVAFHFSVCNIKKKSGIGLVTRLGVPLVIKLVGLRVTVLLVETLF